MTGRRALLMAVLLVSACSDDSQPALPSTAPPPAATAATTSGTTTTAVPITVSIRIVSQNILHGEACPPETAKCQLADRIALFMRQLRDASCPEIVAIQEANEGIVDLLRSQATECNYERVGGDGVGIDQEVVLTTLPVIDRRGSSLVGGFRSALAVRLDAPVGTVDLFTTHLAASSDDVPCQLASCPPPCDPTDRVQVCQARQFTAGLALSSDSALTVMGGDLNASPGEPTYRVMTDAGLIDSYLAAGRPECSPQAARNCTSGREDTSMEDLTDPASQQHERIDYLFVRPLPARCAIGPSTGLFNADPASGPIAYPSDHTGVVLELVCEPGVATAGTFPSPAPPSTAPTTTSTTTATSVADHSVDEITSAFVTLFDGADPDVDHRLANLENGDGLRDTFITLLETAGPSATASSVRVDSVALTGAATADVVFSVLLSGAVVFDHLHGTAVKEEGRWLVSAETFCALATTLAPSLSGCVADA
jgi:endonuclease/exonuclease/phosphatase family metal-dependent hydrolase